MISSSKVTKVNPQVEDDPTRTSIFDFLLENVVLDIAYVVDSNPGTMAVQNQQGGFVCDKGVRPDGREAGECCRVVLCDSGKAP